ncbi:type VII secretion-associated serine protease mycosin [Mycolicibacterium madagascariense]|uniref:type VII secretion-associated serine protease mycosin n=1 Tax=Mycolicibacterium madagascariense TaxID=212765 RepID=UPI0013D2A5F2|nr:type VII secretion-associated serine protease mycosin [Mycolicibacterium madagascariense]
MLRIVAVAAVLIVVVAPGAGAVPPPTVDEAHLPPPAPPAPPTRTEPFEACRVGLPADGPGAPALSPTELRAVWRLTTGAGQTVAVIDTGVARHRLLPHLLPGGDYVSTGDGTQDCDGHGTIVAGIVGAAQSGTGTFGGIAPDAAILSIRQSSSMFRTVGGSGAGVGDVETLAAAVRRAADAGATVINVSSVACVLAEQGLDDRALGAALAYAVDVKNVVVVSAAGNVGGAGQCPRPNPGTDPARPGRPRWDTVRTVVSPAWYDDYVLTVGSVDHAGRPSAFTMAGPWVDVAAPGEAVVSLNPSGEGLIDADPETDGRQPISGTSYAAAIVSGIVALVRSVAPELTARQVMRRICDTAHHPTAGWDPLSGHGTVDALAAVSADGARPAPAAAPPRRADDRVPAASDPAARRIALAGAAACVAVAAGSMSLSANRLRGRREPIAKDAGGRGAELGPVGQLGEDGPRRRFGIRSEPE